MSALQCEVTCAKVLLLEFCRVGHCWDLPGRVVLEMMGLGFEWGVGMLGGSVEVYCWGKRPGLFGPVVGTGVRVDSINCHCGSPGRLSSLAGCRFLAFLVIVKMRIEGCLPQNRWTEFGSTASRTFTCFDAEDSA